MGIILTAGARNTDNFVYQINLALKKTEDWRAAFEYDETRTATKL